MTLDEVAVILERALGQDQARVALEAICREAAGESLYIPRRAARPEIRPSDTPQALQKKYGISRTTAYNWVNNWRR